MVLSSSETSFLLTNDDSHSSSSSPSILSCWSFRPSFASCDTRTTTGRSHLRAMGQEAGDGGAEAPEQTVLLQDKKGATVIQTKTTADDPPVDRNNYVYMIFLLHGVGVLMAWNMFITAKSYFVDYKLALNATFVHMNHTDNNDTWSDSEKQLHEDVTEYRSNFLSYVGLAAQIPNVLCNALNLVVRSRSGNLNVRITGMIVIECLVFLLTILLALVDSSHWPGAFFWITMLSVVAMNSANGVYQSAVYGVAGKLPLSYSNAVVIGSNVCGTLVTLINIVSKAAAPDPRTAAIYYFVATLAVLVACLITFHILSLNPYYRYFEQRDGGSQDQPKRRFGLVFRQIWPQCVNVFTVFFVTLSIFPAVQSDVKSMGQLDGTLGSYFTLITCYLVFNGCAMIGNLIPGIGCWPSPQRLWIPVFARFLFVPFFLLCNYKPEDRLWPVWVTNDYVFVMGGSLMGLTSGYFSSLCMMYAPKSVDPQDAGTAGMMASFFLMLGIFSGINSSFILAAIVT